jgi:hypothetical protein
VSLKRYGDLDRGWRRLVHDASHDAFGIIYPARKPHGGLHADLELRMARYVIAKGWLDGRLRAPEPAKPTVDEARALKLERLRVRISSWERKRKTADTYLKKLRRQIRRLERTTP